jgi:hypothetical protein
MLPSFPKSQKIVDGAWQKRMFAAKAEVFPHDNHPPVLPIIEGKSADFQREDRQVKPLRMKKRQITIRHKITEGKGMALDELYKPEFSGFDRRHRLLAPPALHVAEAYFPLELRPDLRQQQPCQNCVLPTQHAGDN